MKDISADTEYSRIFFFELKKLSDIALTFHHHFQSIMAVSWWRSKRTETQNKLLTGTFRFKYTDRDAEKARDHLIQLTDSEELPEINLRKAALEFKDIGMLQSTLSLFNQCLKTSTYSDLDRGRMHGNIAVILRV